MRNALLTATAALLCLAIAPETRPAETPETLGDKIVAFCVEHKGEQVGNGICEALITHAMRAVHAKEKGKLVVQIQANDDDGPHGIPKVTHGTLADIRPGDVVEFTFAKFVRHEGNTTVRTSADHHVAIAADTSDGGNVIHIYQQNVNGKKYVLSSHLHIPDLTKGQLHIYRPEPHHGKEGKEEDDAKDDPK